MKHSNFSRVLSVMLVLVMVLSMVPAAVFAADSATATLVTDISALSAGDQVVIVASGHDYALSTNQKTNNRGASAVTKADSTVTLDDTVQILTLEAGAVDGTFAFYTGSGYLYAAGQSKAQNGSKNNNYLKTQSTLDANGSWLISIADGVASIVAQGDNGCNVMQYNASSTLFAAYSSASQASVSLYKLGGGSSTEPTDPAPSEPAPSDPVETERATGLVTDPGVLQAGDTIVIFNPANGKTLATTYSGYYNQANDVVLTDGVLTGYTDADIWTVGINNDGTYTFATAEGKKE